MFTIWKVDDNEPLNMYNRKLKPMKSTIKEYRELSMNIDNHSVKKAWASDSYRRSENEADDEILLGL